MGTEEPQPDASLVEAARQRADVQGNAAGRLRRQTLDLVLLSFVAFVATALAVFSAQNARSARTTAEAGATELAASLKGLQDSLREQSGLIEQVETTAAEKASLVARLQTLEANPTATVPAAGGQRGEAEATVTQRTPTTTPQAPPTVEPQAEVRAARANVRTGPGSVYPIVSSYTRGTKLRLLGRNRSGDWLLVRGPEIDRHAWIARSIVEANVDVEALPEVAAPSPPKLSPTRSLPAVPPSATSVPPATPMPSQPDESIRPPAPPTPTPAEPITPPATPAEPKGPTLAPP